MTTPALAASLAALTAASALHAQTRVVYVDQIAPAGGDGSSWQRAFRELDVALAAIRSVQLENAVEVRVAQGIYRPSMGNPSEPAFELSASSRVASGFSFSLLGSFAGLRGPDPDLQDFVATPTTLSGDLLADDLPEFQNRDDNRGPVLYKPSSTRAVVDLRALRVRGGRSASSAGGIEIELPSSARGNLIQDCLIEDNLGVAGGGLNVWLGGGPSPFVVRRCLFRANRAQIGGGAYFSRPTDLFDCTFESNVAEVEGGGVASSHPVTLDRCILADNQAPLGGGAKGTLQLSNSLVVANRADIGGGIAGDSASIFTSTIVDNQARVGGGISAVSDTHRVGWCILARNHASEHGPNIAVGPLRPNAEFVLQFTMIDTSQASIYSPFNVPTYFDMLQADARPRFVNPAGADMLPSSWRDNDYRLKQNSPAIDASAWLPPAEWTDLDRQPRVVAADPSRPARIDLGCYEYQPHCPADINQDDAVTIDDLLDFLSAFTLGQPLADVDDGSATGTPDDGVTIDDLLYFLIRFEAGC